MLDAVLYVLFSAFVIVIAFFGLISVVCFSLMGIEIIKEILKDWGWF